RRRSAGVARRLARALPPPRVAPLGRWRRGVAELGRPAVAGVAADRLRAGDHRRRPPRQRRVRVGEQPLGARLGRARGRGDARRVGVAARRAPRQRGAEDAQRPIDAIAATTRLHAGLAAVAGGDGDRCRRERHAARAARRRAVSGQARTVAALGAAQTLAWASSYYLPAVLAAPMARDLGVAMPTVFAAFSAALLVSAALGPRAGAAIDRWGGRPVLIA